MIIFTITLFVWTSSKVEATIPANVGTVLFTKDDARNMTWPKDKLALLKARLYTQHLMPPLNSPQPPDFVDCLLKYFHNTYAYIHHVSKDPETEQTLATAFSDVVGGYLKMFALPQTKYGYYGGTMPKRDVMKLLIFYEEVKNFLDKGDAGWTDPAWTTLNPMTVEVEMAAASYRRDLLPDPCHHLSYFQRTSEGLVIPTPIVDWKTHTMFIPLTDQTLVNLCSSDMSNALHKYYDVASNCVRSKRPSQVASFNKRFQTWLQGDVVPHLMDDSLYVALQGVLSLLNSTNDLTAYTVYKDVTKTWNADPTHHIPSTQMIIVLIIVAIELIWCFPTIIYMFYRRRKDNCGGVSSCHSCVNTILKTQSKGRSQSEFCDAGQDFSKIVFKQRRGGMQFTQRPKEEMKVGEVYSHPKVFAAGTEPSGRREDVATMVDEAPKKISTTQTVRCKRSDRHKSTTPHQTELKQLPSNGTSKTAMLSAQSPSKPTCLICSKSSKQLQTVLAAASVELSAEQTCPSKGEVSDQKATELEYTADLPVKRTNRSSKSLRTSDNKSTTELREHRLLEIRIDRPQREISVDVSGNGEVITVVKRPKKSKIPKKSKGTSAQTAGGTCPQTAVKTSPQMVKRPSPQRKATVPPTMMGTATAVASPQKKVTAQPATMGTAIAVASTQKKATAPPTAIGPTTVVGTAAAATKPVSHRSLVHKPIWAIDDIALQSNIGTKTRKLNDTL